ARRRNAHLEMGLAMTAHELHRPLQTARMVMECLLDDQLEPAQGRDLLREAHRELGDMASMVASLLPWSVGRASLDRRPLDMSVLLRRAVDENSFEGAGERVRVDAPARSPVLGDHTQLQCVLSNLVHNALVYSPEGGQVIVTARASHGTVRVSVHDRGPGIPHADREWIFDPFVRGACGRGRNGAGLGLFIARRVVEAHGGEIWVESNGNGSTFHVELARAA